MARLVKRISDLPEAAPIQGDELLEMVQNGENVKVDLVAVRGDVLWGEITGDIEDQEDLVLFVDEKIGDIGLILDSINGEAT